MEDGSVHDGLDAATKELERAIEFAHQAAGAVQLIAQGVPKQDDWRSAASFMEIVAQILDNHQISRPEHYDNDVAWR